MAKKSKKDSEAFRKVVGPARSNAITVEPVLPESWDYLSDIIIFAEEIGDEELHLLAQTAMENSFSDRKKSVPYDSVVKFLVFYLGWKFESLIGTKGAASGWTKKDYIQTAILKMISEDSGNPITASTYENDLRIKASQVAQSVFRDAYKASPRHRSLPDDFDSEGNRPTFYSDANQQKIIDTYLKREQDQKKFAKVAPEPGNLRILGKEELGKYQNVKLTDEEAKLFSKSEEISEKRKKI